MPAKAKIADTQKGIKSTDNKSIMEAKILRIIVLFYMFCLFIQIFLIKKQFIHYLEHM